MTRGKVDAHAITVKLKTSRKAAETFQLEVQRLASRLGIPAAAVRIRRVTDGRR
jgi:hypothetical protein